jgi:hypothetical protein
MAALNGIDIKNLKKKWGLYLLDDLGARCAEIGSSEQLIEGILPVRSLSVVVGDSGLGKSPLLYQAGLCIASGTPFLGKAVRQGTVLYLDAENGLGDVDDIARKMVRFLDLKETPEGFIGWNLNDCPASWEVNGGAERMIREVHPDVVIIDPGTAFWPELQENNKDAAELYKKLRALMRDSECAIVLVHHIRKSSVDQLSTSIADDPNLRGWFEKARGPRSIINGCDVRLAVDLPGAKSPDDAALVIGGFGRVRGPIPLLHVERVLDEGGDPLGYQRMVGLKLLPMEQREPFEKLANQFRFKDARMAYGKGPQATTDWLGKCQAAGILEKGIGGWYVKVKEPPEMLEKAA